MKMGKKLLIVCTAALLTTGSTAFAITVPPWYGDDGSTYQEWGFADSNLTPLPDVVNNPYGDPLLRVTAVDEWVSEPGAWPLSGEIDVRIPNRQLRLEYKEIWIQLIWQPGDRDQSPYLPDEPVVGVTSQPMFTLLEMSRTAQMDFVPGWNWSVFKVKLYPNPDIEWITIKGDIVVDHLVIDTVCIPEPASLVLFGISALITLTWKRRSV